MSDEQHSIARRLVEVRSLAGIKQSDLAKRMGLSPSLVSHWEKGTRTPSQIQLLHLARELGVTIDYILKSEVRPQFHFRAQAASTLKPPQRTAIERALVDASLQIHYVDTALRLASETPSPFMLSAEFTSVPALPSIASQFRETLRLNRRVTLAEFKQALSEWNIHVFEWSLPWHLSGLSFRGPLSVIFINASHDRTRRLFTLAHEFAHVLFHLGRETAATGKRDETAVSIASCREPIEKEANAFAGEFLMPTGELKNLIAKHGAALRDPAYLEAAARTFNVSRDALFYRLTQLGFLSWTQSSRYFLRQFEPGEPKAHRVEKIQSHVDVTFLQTALALYQQNKISSGKLAQWLFAPRHIVDAYLAELEEQKDNAISADPHGEEDAS